MTEEVKKQSENVQITGKVVGGSSQFVSSADLLKAVSASKTTPEQPEKAAPQPLRTPKPLKFMNELPEETATIKPVSSSDGSQPNINIPNCFSNKNTLLTAENGELSIDNDTRRMLALFSDGLYFVAKEHQFDGKVLNFSSIVKRRKLAIEAPQLVPESTIAEIYAFAKRGTLTPKAPTAASAAKPAEEQNKVAPKVAETSKVESPKAEASKVENTKAGAEKVEDPKAGEPKKPNDAEKIEPSAAPSEKDEAAAPESSEQKKPAQKSQEKPKLAVNENLAVEEQDEEQKDNILARLFAKGNVLLTADGGEIVVDNETRRMLALFADGTYLVDKDHQFDGKVLNFTSIVKRRKIPINPPEYVSASEIAAIYNYAERGTGVISVSAEEASDYQMQIDFLSVINRASAKKVSDIHVIVADSTVVLFRVSGMMTRELEYSKDWGEAFVRAAFASADISDANYAQNEFQGAQKLGETPLRGTDGKLRLPHNVLAIRLQFNPVAFGSQYLVMRLLYADDNPKGNSDLRSLGLGARELNLFYRLRATAVGLNIIAGPTGSGKSTTLQRNMIKLIQERNNEINVITVEDPPEYPIPGARQMPVTNANTEAEKDEEFTKALSAALRSDPDILMVGEIRSLSTASLVFKGALSGHGVWSTLHANSAPAIITRLRDMGVQPYMLSDPEIIKGLISQRLFRKICPYCRVPVKERESDPSFERLKTALGDYGIENTYLRGPGCKYCGHQGVIGRMSVPEIIVPDGHFLQLLVNGDVKNAIDYWVSELDGRPLKEAAIERMLKGYIDLDEVERWCGLLDQRPIY